MSTDFDNPKSGAVETRPGPQHARKTGILRGRILWVGALIGGAAVLALGVKLPHEIMRLQENQSKIRSLQEANADLRKRRDERLQRLKELQENSDLLDLEIQKSLKLYREDQRIFILPKQREAESVMPDTGGN